MNATHPAFAKLSTLLDTAGLPALDNTVRPARWPVAKVNSTVESAFAEARIPATTEPLVRSLVLLWHDHLDESHSISQDIHSADGSFLHGIMHRREPDYGNAKYWFHRVGAHACYPIIAEKVAGALDAAKAAGLKAKLFRDGQWDAFAFVDACESALRSRDQPTIGILQRVQEIECKTLLEYFLRQS